MQQRGVTVAEVEDTINRGWDATDAKPGCIGKVMVYNYDREWEGSRYPQKEVTVYFKVDDGRLILLTVKARYGHTFSERQK